MGQNGLKSITQIRGTLSIRLLRKIQMLALPVEKSPGIILIYCTGWYCPTGSLFQMTTENQHLRLYDVRVI